MQEINGNDVLKSRFGNFLKVAKSNLSIPIIDLPTSKKLANHGRFERMDMKGEISS